MPRRLRDLQMPAHLVELLTRRELPVAFVERADDLFRRVRRRFLAMSLLLCIRVAQRVDHYEGLTSRPVGRWSGWLVNRLPPSGWLSQGLPPGQRSVAVWLNRGEVPLVGSESRHADRCFPSKNASSNEQP